MLSVIVVKQSIVASSIKDVRHTPTNAGSRWPAKTGQVLPIGLLGTTNTIVMEAPIEAIINGVVGRWCIRVARYETIDAVNKTGRINDRTCLISFFMIIKY